MIFHTTVPRPPFAAEEEQFRRRFLVALSIVGAVCTFAFVIGSWSGVIPPLSKEQIGTNIASVCLSGIVVLATWTYPDRWMPLAFTQSINFAVVFLVALYTMPNDELRYIWFFIEVGATFLLLGTVAGWVTVSASIVIVTLSKAFGAIILSATGLSTFCVSLVGMAAVLHCHHLEALSYREQIGKARDAAKFAAEHDSLTGLLNRYALSKIGSRLWSGRLDWFPVSLIFLDVDHFKLINDRYGHEAGDEVLRAVASATKECARKTDFVARFGGEEIVVLSPRTDQVGAYHLAERIRQTIESCTPRVGNQKIRVTVSVGWSTVLSSEVSIDEMIREADIAMYKVKSSGRNGVFPVLA